MGPVEGFMLEEGMYNGDPLYNFIAQRFNNSQAIKGLDIGLINILNSNLSRLFIPKTYK
jgi:hypothetical protein